MANYASNKPKSRYYVYNGEGVVIDILTKKPSDSVIDEDNGNYFYPYFEENYYDSNRQKVITKGSTIKTPDAMRVFLNGTYYNSQSIEVTDEEKAFEEEHGVVTALPSCTYDGATYYFDTIINNGDLYDGTHFSAMNRKSTLDVVDTYGTLLKNMVKSSLRISSFASDVKAIPIYLRDINNTTFNNIDVDDYNLTQQDFAIYGTIYCELLLDYMKEQGDAMVKKISTEITSTSLYKDLKIEADYEENYDIIKAVPSSFTPVTTITLFPSSITLQTGETETLTAAVEPDNANTKEVSWKSSNTKVAIVDATGKVTGIGMGNATITCTSTDGYGARSICKVMVYDTDKLASVVTINGEVATSKEWTDENGKQYYEVTSRFSNSDDVVTITVPCPLDKIEKDVEGDYKVLFVNTTDDEFRQGIYDDIDPSDDNKYFTLTVLKTEHEPYFDNNVRFKIRYPKTV